MKAANAQLMTAEASAAPHQAKAVACFVVSWSLRAGLLSVLPAWAAGKYRFTELGI